MVSDTAIDVAKEKYQSLLAKVRTLPQPKIYRNSTTVVSVGSQQLTVWDTLTAAILSNLNTLLLGERGEGKTQLENEVKDGLFGGRATYIRMRDNLRIKDMFEVYNLGKLIEGKGTVLDAKEQTAAIRNPMTIIDEINRAHEKVQNQVFDIYDGYIVFDGPKGPQKIALGVPVEKDLYFHASIASANLGGSRYTGTSPIDPALLDRSHLILDVDNFTPTTLDTALILSETTTAKIIDYHNSDHTSDIVDIYRSIKDVKLSLDALVTLVFLKKGLDHCINPENPSRSKTPILSMLPSICEGCNELGNGCGYTYPVSMRSEKAIALLAKGLKVVADAKANTFESLRVRYQDVLAAFRLVAPYSGMLDEQWVKKEYLGNEQIAINALAGKIAGEVHSLTEVMRKATGDALSGNLAETTRSSFIGQWSWYNDILMSINEATRTVGKIDQLSPEDLTHASKQYPILRWLE